jgi:hypothetical protein
MIIEQLMKQRNALSIILLLDANQLVIKKVLSLRSEGLSKPYLLPLILPL